jgi:thiosulfate reductase cytochrome b subunit
MARPEEMDNNRHSTWVRTSHWIVTVSFFSLLLSGFVILMCHPRLYWGETGNDLTPALFELPVSRNYQHGGWDKSNAFFNTANSAVSANRTYEIFNENGWGRSLHFLSAWFLVITGLTYLVMGFVSKHFRRHVMPTRKDLSLSSLGVDMRNHLALRVPRATRGPHYGVLQKIVYLTIIFFVFPLMIVTGLAMSPAVTAPFPFLSDMFGGSQSARTIHFFASAGLVLFLIAHLIMVILSGFKTQIRAMTFGK